MMMMMMMMLMMMISWKKIQEQHADAANWAVSSFKCALKVNRYTLAKWMSAKEAF